MSRAASAASETTRDSRPLDHVPPVWPGQERPHQLDLDLDVDALDSAATRAVALGATELGGGPYWRTLADPTGHVNHGATYLTEGSGGPALADPAGHPFCLHRDPLLGRAH